MFLQKFSSSLFVLAVSSPSEGVATWVGNAVRELESVDYVPPTLQGLESRRVLIIFPHSLFSVPFRYHESAVSIAALSPFCYCIRAALLSSYESKPERST